MEVSEWAYQLPKAKQFSAADNHPECKYFSPDYSGFVEKNKENQRKVLFYFGIKQALGISQDIKSEFGSTLLASSSHADVQTYPTRFKTRAPSAMHIYSWEYSTPHRASAVRKTLRLVPKCTQGCIPSKIPVSILSCSAIPAAGVLANSLQLFWSWRLNSV